MQLNFVIQLTIKIRNYGSNYNYLKVIKMEMEEITINVAWIIICFVLVFLFFFNDEEENPNE